MKIGFNQSDGSFEIALSERETLPSEWNIEGVIVYRETTQNRYMRIKDYLEVLES